MKTYHPPAYRLTLCQRIAKFMLWLVALMTGPFGRRFRVGNIVQFLSQDLHDSVPHYYPRAGTIGIIDAVDGDTAWVQWPSGSTSGNDRWNAALCDLKKVRRHG